MQLSSRNPLSWTRIPDSTHILLSIVVVTSTIEWWVTIWRQGITCVSRIRSVLYLGLNKKTNWFYLKSSFNTKYCQAIFFYLSYLYQMMYSRYEIRIQCLQTFINIVFVALRNDLSLIGNITERSLRYMYRITRSSLLLNTRSSVFPSLCIGYVTYCWRKNSVVNNSMTAAIFRTSLVDVELVFSSQSIFGRLIEISFV